VWHEFKNPVRVEIYEQPFLLPHYCGRSDLPNIREQPFPLSHLTACEVLLQWPKQMVCCMLPLLKVLLSTEK
jgi:hypothetical protein